MFGGEGGEGVRGMCTKVLSVVRAMETSEERIRAGEGKVTQCSFFFLCFGGCGRVGVGTE